MMIVFRKSHPVTQAMTSASVPADLVDGEIRRNPGEPSPAQADANTYNKPRIQWRGLTIAIENPAGSIRRGKNRAGATWEIRVSFDYGEVVGSMGVDGDPVDIYLGPALEDAPMVYVVHQRQYGNWGAYDEDKAMAGFMSEADAVAAFLSNYDDPRFLGPVTAMPVDEFVAKVRATKENPAMIKSILFFKAHVGAYLRGGKLVNVAGYQGRNARAQASPGQMSLFGGPTSGKPLPPSKLDGKDAIAHTPDMFDDVPAKTGVTVNDPAPKAAPADEHDHLLSDFPEGTKWARGMGRIKGHYAVELPGNDVVGNYHEKPEDAAAQAKEWLSNRASSAKEKADRAAAIADLRARLMAGGEPTDRDIERLRLKAGSSGLKWFIPAAAEVFGITSHAVRPFIKDLIRFGHTDMGTKLEFVSPAKGLQAIAAGMQPPKAAPDDADKANPRKKYYVTMIRDGARRQVARLAGPFDRHEDALDHVERARHAAYEADPRSHWDAFGTAGVEADEHKPGVLNERLGIKPKAAPYTPVTDDSHPAPMPRSLLGMVPDDRRDEWKDLHRQQHELHHYELGQVREKLGRHRSKRNKAEAAMNEAEAGVRALRGAPIPDPTREAEVQKNADAKRADFVKLTREQDGLVGQHQSLYEKIAKLGRAKEGIAAGTGDMDVDWAAMRKRTAEEQRSHEKSMLSMYREHYKAKPMTKAIVFLGARPS